MKSRSSAIYDRMVLTKILMLIGKIQAFRIRRIMLILENLKTMRVLKLDFTQ